MTEEFVQKYNSAESYEDKEKNEDIATKMLERTKVRLRCYDTLYWGHLLSIGQTKIIHYNLPHITAKCWREPR